MIPVRVTSWDEIDFISRVLEEAVERRLSVRFSQDGGGIKIKMGNGVWSPPMGKEEHV